MPVELFLSPFMRPVVKAHAAVMSLHRENSQYTPTILDLPAAVQQFTVRKEFGTGSKVFSVFDASDPSAQTYHKRLYHMTRSRAVKGAYKMYHGADDKPVAALRAGLRSNVMLIKAADGGELELGWHVVSHKTDALDSYRLFQLADGQTYQWTMKGHFLERVHNIGQKESEVRERLAQVVVHPNKKGFDLRVAPGQANLEMVLSTALICYIEAWNTWRSYGGIYLAEQPAPALSWKRD